MFAAEMFAVEMFVVEMFAAESFTGVIQGEDYCISIDRNSKN